MGASSPWWSHRFILVLLPVCEGFLLTSSLLAPLLHRGENTLLYTANKMFEQYGLVLVRAGLKDGNPAAPPSRTSQNLTGFQPSAARDNTPTSWLPMKLKSGNVWKSSSSRATPSLQRRWYCSPFPPSERENPWDWACVLERKQTGMCVRAASFVSKRGLRSLCLSDCKEANKSKCSIVVEPPWQSHESGFSPKASCAHQEVQKSQVCSCIHQKLTINIYISLLFFETFSQWRIFI